MLRGERPDWEVLAGWEYRGWNVPPVTKLLGIRKFIKGFYKTPDGAALGYNTPVRQNRPDEPWIASTGKRRTERVSDATVPKRYAFYSVGPVDPEVRDNAYPNALLLDYGRGGNARYDVARLLRDYLVRVEPGSDDLLLGKAYLALGPVRLAVGYFVLERHGLIVGLQD